VEANGRRAVILGGTGAIGGATALRLAGAGWQVHVTGRDPAAVPEELSRAGVTFHRVDRADSEGLDHLIGDGTALLVDLVAYRARDVQQVLAAMRRVTCCVVVSSRAVYLDPDGRHINGDLPPRFPVPISEDNATVSPAGPDVDPFTRHGYAPSKVAVERAALDSGLPVTVLRPSKVHGRWARNARTRGHVDLMSRDVPLIELAHGSAVDHLTAAENAAALIETVADAPAARVLNSADPDTPSAVRVVGRIAELVGWTGRLELLEAEHGARGRHPWQSVHPIVLDSAAASAMGYRPVGTGLDLLAREVDWLLEGRARPVRSPGTP
jgi:nucleoside-diphosphate-sugar epimerase